MVITSSKLDPQVDRFLSELERQALPPLDGLSAIALRQMSNAFMQTVSRLPDPQIQIRNMLIPGTQNPLLFRTYTPSGRGPFPVLVYFHGGGWSLSNVQLYDGLCSSLAQSAGCVVVSVDYRLAPEHKFPAGLEDCYLATQWLMGNAPVVKGDPTRIVVGGDSAGGSLAAVVARLIRDSLRYRKVDQPLSPLVGQLLLYPVTNLADFATRSYQKFARGYFLTRDTMEWFREQYLANDVDRFNPDASPLLIQDLSDLPPTYMVTAGYDVLRDEAEAYANRLHTADNTVEVKRYDSMIHGFLNMGALFDQAEVAIAETAEQLRLLFTKQLI